MNASFTKVALIGKYKSPDIAMPLLDMAHFLEERGIAVLLDRLTAVHIDNCRFPVMDLDELGAHVDLAIVIGGDGTMLNIARTLAPQDVPLVGVNQGRLGFLTDISVHNMFETIGQILDGKYVTESRMLLAAEVVSKDQPVFKVLALNDAVVTKGSAGNMIEFDVRIDGQFVYTLRSDGLIVSSPTGSTAYALSSGGPILYPTLRLMALVPVCPHTLSARPIVVSGDSLVEVRMHEAEDVRVHFDSHTHFDLNGEDRVRIRSAPHEVRLLHPVGHSYYRMLREKLRWSESL
ncbi:MAG: NAD kinase [Burkholderiales bacterium]